MNEDRQALLPEIHLLQKQQSCPMTCLDSGPSGQQTTDVIFISVLSFISYIGTEWALADGNANLECHRSPLFRKMGKKREITAEIVSSKPSLLRHWEQLHRQSIQYEPAISHSCWEVEPTLVTSVFKPGSSMCNFITWRWTFSLVRWVEQVTRSPITYFE